MSVVSDSYKLSRPERRALENKAKKGIGAYIIGEITSKIENSVMVATIDLFSVAVAWVLKNKLNYGDKKVKQTMKQINLVFDDINSGKLDLNRMKNILDEECDLVFSRSEDVNNV